MSIQKSRDKLVLLSGCPRSGTTMLNILLNSHPNIAITNECNLIKFLNELDSTTLFKRFGRVKKNNFKRPKSPRETWGIETLKSYVPQKENIFNEIIKDLCFSIKDFSSNKIYIYGDKTPKYYKEDLHDFAKKLGIPIYIIHVTRNPLFVISSIMRRYKNNQKGIDSWKSITSISQAIDEWIEAWNWRISISKSFCLLDLNYDFAVKDPSKLALEISNFLEIENKFDINSINSNEIELEISTKEIYKENRNLEKYILNWESLPLLLDSNKDYIIKEIYNHKRLLKETKHLFRKVITEIMNITIFKKIIYLIKKKISNFFSVKSEIKLTKSIVLDNACKFVINECVIGDYYEFGVFRGQTLLSAFKRLKSTADKRIRLSKDIGANDDADLKRNFFRSKISFHAFDSFEGLPSFTEEDNYSNDFFPGQFKSSEGSLIKLAKENNLSSDQLIIHKGWFSKTCNYKYFKKNNLRPASIIWLDCDIYSSAKEAFQLIQFILQDGTVLVIDDWFSNKGSPLHGVQKAFYEFSSSKDIKSQFIFTEYLTDSWKRKSFITNRI